MQTRRMVGEGKDTGQSVFRAKDVKERQIVKDRESDKQTDRQILIWHGNCCKRTSMQVGGDTVLMFTLTETLSKRN